jgi:ribosomal-protein-alanine N-acetyltransferase
MTTLKTERLTLRPMQPDDAEAYANMRYHPDVARWLLPATGDPVDAAHAAIARYGQSWRDRGYGPWAIIREQRLIGHAGLNFVPEFGETEVLWSLHPDNWGRGFATEAGRAALDFGFRALGLKLIFAMTRPDNYPSQAVMARLGLGYRKDVVYRDVGSVWFDVDRAGWLRM